MTMVENITSNETMISTWPCYIVNEHWEAVPRYLGLGISEDCFG
jgi:hypothetical protein